MSDPGQGNDGGDDAGLIAVIGMAGRFPGSANVSQFWQNLKAGVESVRWFTDDELLALGESPALLRDPQYVKACPILDDIDKFDAGFFGFTPREAAITDPQHRIFFETAWAALESAALVPERYPGVVGVFASCGLNTYLMHHLVTNQELMDTVGEWLLRHTGNDMNFLATRFSYELDLRGPSMNVQTACSSSLVAIHLAAQSLLAGECDAALAGGATISFPLRGYLYKEGEILSEDGHCRPFDAASTGTLFGSGTGAVVLKRLADARADGDTIWAVVRGSAINNDGSQKVGYLAPSVEGQARAVAEAMAIAGVEPDSISYVESHGTGTLIGDPIEVTALIQAYRTGTDRTGYCGLGSLKSNIGHLGEAAGVSGFIKTVLALHHRELPPSINYDAPNPSIDFPASPFYVVREHQAWPATGGPRRAGVTALGAGGTNAHVILEEAPARPAAASARRWQLLPLSARTPAALDLATRNLAAHLRATPGLSLADAAHTLQLGRRAFSHRRTLACRDVAEAIALLEGGDPKRVATQVVPNGAKRELVFMFAGGGAQYAGMGRELYDTEPVYRAAIDECLAVARTEVKGDLRGLMFPPAGEEEAASARLEAPSVALPALFATEYAMAVLLGSWGLTPAAMIGHSMGEYVAACRAGVISARDGMRLVATRGRLFETLPEGGMLVVPLAAEEARRALPDFDRVLSFAAINAPELCVASGPVEHIARLEQALAEREIDGKRVHISVAAHSAMLEPILKPFEDFCRTIAFAKPERPYVSNLTGTWIRPTEATDPRYWVQHLRHTVRFADGIATILAAPDRVLLEVGPGRTLASLARQQSVQPVAALATIAHPKEAQSAAGFLLSTVGQLWLAGIELDWSRLHEGETRRKVDLPTYPFERQRHWIERPAAGALEQARPRDRALRKRPDVADWFWVPSWRRTVAPAASTAEAATRRLIVMDNQGLGERLRLRWPDAVVVSEAAAFEKTGAQTFTVNLAERAQVDALCAELRREQRLPEQIVHLGAVSALGRDGDAVATCFTGLFHLAQALALEEKSVELLVVSAGGHQIHGQGHTDPRKGLLLGPVRVIPSELPELACRQVDLVWPAATPWAEAEVEDQLVAEAGSSAARAPGGDIERVVAYRGAARLTQTFEATRLPAAAAPALRPGGCYLITGGLGGVGLAIADHLARTQQAKLVLVGRAGLPPRADWPRLRDHAGPGPRIRAVEALEAAGAEVLVGAADVANLEQMSAVLAATTARFGRLHGVIHAAGVLDDGLIQMKTAESCAAVLGPKVKGALVLDTLLRGDAAPADFFALFSSVSAVLGLQGQIDYGAANAFLDALAAERATREPGLTVSINWSAWRDVGMAAAMAARGRRPEGGRGPKARHTWLGERLSDTGGRLTYGADVGRDGWWLLAEHVVRGGEALIPGTGFLELARAAVAESAGSERAIELRDVLFLSPFVVKKDEHRALRIELDQGAGELTIGTAVGGHIDPHMTARARAVDAAAAPPVDLAALARRCPDRRELADRNLPQSFMAFGPRWSNVVSMAFGEREALLELELAAPFVGDLGEHQLHPALLDMATGGAQALIPGFTAARDFYVPFSYERVFVRRGLTPRVWSHLRYHADSSPDQPTFDATLVDGDGRVLVDITGFVMKRVAAGASLTAGAAKESVPAPAATSAATELREAAFREGMLPAEGIDAFTRILAARLGPQVVATSLDLLDWIAATTPRAADPAAAGATAAAAASSGAAARPAVSTPFEAPRNGGEEAVAAVWRTMLGIGELGIHDNFFELGGHSLLLTQTVTRVRKQAQLDLPLRTLLSKLTIAEMAEEIARARSAGVTKAPVMKTMSRDAFRVKRSSLTDPPGSGGDKT